MKGKCAVFLTVVILIGSINGLTGVNPSAINQNIGYITVKAAETEEGKEDLEDIDKIENENIEELEDMEKKDDGVEIDQETAEDNLKRNCVYNVLFPTNPRAYFDPENLSGKGQIFSEEFKVENYGNTDVAIRIKNIEVHYNSAIDVYELSEERVSDNRSDIKKINVDVIWKNESQNLEKVLNVSEGISDEYVLLLKAAQYDENNNFIGLNDSSMGSFYFSGTLNSNRDLVWEDGEVQIFFDYEIENIDGEMLLLGEDGQEQQTDLGEEDAQGETVLQELPETGGEIEQQERSDSGKDEELQEHMNLRENGEQRDNTDIIQEADQGQRSENGNEAVYQQLQDTSQEAGYPEVERKTEKEEEK